MLFIGSFNSNYIEELRGRPNVCGTFARHTIVTDDFSQGLPQRYQDRLQVTQDWLASFKTNNTRALDITHYLSTLIISRCVFVCSFVRV